MIFLSLKTNKDGGIIGANSVVAKDLPPYHLAVGNPCKVIKFCCNCQTLLTRTKQSDILFQSKPSLTKHKHFLFQIVTNMLV